MPIFTVSLNQYLIETIQEFKDNFYDCAYGIFWYTDTFDEYGRPIMIINSKAEKIKYLTLGHKTNYNLEDLLPGYFIDMKRF